MARTRADSSLMDWVVFAHQEEASVEEVAKKYGGRWRFGDISKWDGCVS
ncbi:hypothetical protein TcasGA2_TC014262 [Tribolium castaneum]|uniref:Uncharacterized protein n=1 Tax=Tribolium castaneum TaxID=7070 RepID=D6WKX1_TRICA|nr:hypothetical protein TcasGA2_TC014262 [Tribolium castaneum]